MLLKEIQKKKKELEYNELNKIKSIGGIILRNKKNERERVVFQINTIKR